MIAIDPAGKGIVPKESIKKVNRKEEDKKARFPSKMAVQKSSSGYTADEVSSIAPMLFLQEIDDYPKDLQNFNEFADKAFKSLRELQLSLIQGTLSIERLYNLKNSLNSAQDKFITPELEQLAEEIKVRIEVEIAKIEVNKT